MTEKLVLIDGNSLLYRAYYALPLLHNDKGVYTNAVYGFTTILLNILEEEKPTHMLVAFDAGKTTFRHKSFKDYKGGRQKTPPELSEQFPLTKELLGAFNIPFYELDLYEADDIIGTLAKQASDTKWEVKVISGDQDLLQLVSDQVTVDLTKKGVSEVASYTPESLFKEMELNPEQIIELKALMGDSSDNIPGVPGVGIKTATKLLKEYGTVDEIYYNLDKITAKKLNENLRTYKDSAYLSKELVTINQESPIEIKLKDTKYEGYEDEELVELFQKLEFRSLLERFGGEEEKVEKEIAYEVITEIKTDMLVSNSILVIESNEDNYHTAPIIAIGLINQTGNYVFKLETAKASEEFIAFLADERKLKSVFDLKSATVTLHKEGLLLKGVDFDFMLAAYLVDPAQKNESISVVARRLGHRYVELDETLYGKGKKRSLPEFDLVAEHVAKKNLALTELKADLIEGMKSNDQIQLFEDLEGPLASVLAEMEIAGIKVNRSTLEEMDVELRERLEVIEQKVYDLANEEFNINSPKQLGVILFEKLKLPVIKKTKTGYSTAADVLEQLESEHEIIKEILLYRQLKKLHSTYIEGLLKVVYPETGKIHTQFNQALTQTGRLSSTEPNLQNIPIRLEEGRKIRKAFVPSHDDWYIFSADYSQIELRVLAHISGDEKLSEAFKEDKDIHTQTASDVFHVNESEVDGDMRRQAKAVNFGIIYGISDYGLSQNLGITRKEAKSFIDKYLTIYPKVDDYMKEIVKEAKHDGYVTTIMNRRRYLPDITSRNFNQRSFAERTAMNTPIQGSAADIIKKAMIELNEVLVKEKLKSTLLLQVHDELILEVPADELEEIKRLVPRVMEETVKLDVPLKVDYSYGKSWFDAD